MGYFVPETMRKLNNWLLQKDKVPYSPTTRRKTSPASPEGWTTYEEAVLMLKHSDFDGLGFGFLKENGLTFIDIDHCIDEDGVLSKLAEEVLEMFPDTYAEISQSETGLHIVCKGVIPHTIKRADIEIYSQGRYMAFTGNAWTAAEPVEHQRELDMLWNRYKPDKGEQRASIKPQEAYRRAETATAREIVDLIIKSRQGAKFERLHNGEWQNWIYKSQSEAELAYIAIVNHFTRGNDKLTAEVFLSSRLAERAKGQRADYIKRTIDKAKETASGNRNAGIIKRVATDQPEKKRRRF